MKRWQIHSQLLAMEELRDMYRRRMEIARDRFRKEYTVENAQAFIEEIRNMYRAQKVLDESPRYQALQSAWRQSQDPIPVSKPRRASGGYRICQQCDAAVSVFADHCECGASTAQVHMLTDLFPETGRTAGTYAHGLTT